MPGDSYLTVEFFMTDNLENFYFKECGTHDYMWNS